MPDPVGSSSSSTTTTQIFQPHSHSNYHYAHSISEDVPTTLLPFPPPSFGVPTSRPYTSATMASARTYVDPDAELPVPPTPGEVSQVSSVVGHGPPPVLAPEPVVVPQMPQTSLTFLLVSGRRRTMSFGSDTTVGRVKELVWNAWPAEWQDERPPAPSYLRILHLGKILQDEDTLAQLSFPTYTPPSHSPTPPSQHQPQPPPAPTPTSTTIVHLSIRPYAPLSDDDALKKKGRGKGLFWSFGRGGAGNGGGGARGRAGEQDGEEERDRRRVGGYCCDCVVC